MLLSILRDIALVIGALAIMMYAVLAAAVIHAQIRSARWRRHG